MNKSKAIMTQYVHEWRVRDEGFRRKKKKNACAVIASTDALS